MAPTLLIVDDEPHIRLLLEQTLEDLEDEGVEILSAENGADALEIIKTEKPVFVYLDVMMPKMNGFDVCRYVKQELKLDNVYIVLLTAKGQETDWEKGRKAGADKYITKPFDPDEVLQLACTILGIEL